MKLEDLLKVIPPHYSLVDRELITRAYHIAENAHEGQRRASGEPYLNHCVAVAMILAEMNVPPAVVIAGLLHDTVEDTSLTLSDIRREFDDEIAKLVDGVTKLTNLPRVSRGDQHSEDAIIEDDNEAEIIHLSKSRRRDLANETLRKVFLAMGDDARIVLIKLADRLHNMRTLGVMPEEKRNRIAQETLDIFAPLANRLGIWQIKWELEDLSFHHLNPEKYREIAENLAERREDREKQIQSIIQKLRKVLGENGIEAEISGRPKHIYSIYKKMQEKAKPFEMVRDLRAVRCLVKEIRDCYSALGVIHTHWPPIPSEFDDYIAVPKDNFYQSLHTAVIFDDGKPLEVQIRTYQMHQNAEYGVAAHWRYKERGPKDESYEQQINWLRMIKDMRQDFEDAADFVDGMKSDLFQDRVYIFTPRGDIIDLPAGSTPIDFAYLVHTEVGNRCRGAKVNGRLVTLDYALKTGDQVEILLAKQGGPSRDWLNTSLGLVKTQRARSKIRQWFKRQDRDQNLTQGKAILEKELRRLGLTNLDDEKLAKGFDFRTAEDLYVAIGCGDVGVSRIINKISEDNAPKDPLINLPLQPRESKPDGSSINILGAKGLLTNFAHCCNPAPGDEIVGYITRGRGASIHRKDCPNILRLTEKERLIMVSWGEPHNTYPVNVVVKAYDRQGLMNDIFLILGNEDVNLVDFDLKILHGLATISMVLEVGDISQLSRVLTRIESLPNVMEAHRLHPG
jgi:guanosine-3',5'-bis(diphosphate) 3'-pyrophosphohydrolase